MEKMIEFKNVGYIYEKHEGAETVAIDGVSFSVRKGEFIGIIGHNGSGKSTLSKLINAILFPTFGDIWVAGINTKDHSRIWDIRQSAGMVFQNPDNQLVATIVEVDVAFGPENQGVDPLEIRKRVDESLKAVDMYEFRRRPPHLLSGGQKQRIAIAGVLALNSECIILDEPTAMLDPSGRKEVMQTIKRLNKEENKTILLITHFMDEAVEADRVIVIDGGKIQLKGTPKEVFLNVGRLKNFGLDVPQVTELSQILINNGIELPNDIITIEELVEKLCQ
jgi:energy-coupling factor transport system ATP-binding protein